MNGAPLVPLGDVLVRADEPAVLVPDRAYHEVTIKLWGKGVVSRGKVLGGSVATGRRFVRAGQFILSKIDARNGAFGIVPSELDGAIVSNDFPSFALRDAKRMAPAYLGWLVRSPGFTDLCKASSEGTTNRVRIRESRFLDQKVMLPPVNEQHAITAHLNALADKTRKLATHLDAIGVDADRLLTQQFQHTITSTQYRPLAEVAPAIRRSVELDSAKTYREVAARSFGKGLFAKPDFDAAQATWQKPVWVEAGDVVFSNIKAWEGAIALASNQHDGCIASHRYITCLPDPKMLLAPFLLYFLLSDEGLERVGNASPGTADRNRTLSLGNLGKIEVPIPSLAAQQAFVTLQSTIAALKARHTALREANAALIPATLERLFARQSA